jgi:hypothetical protein
MMTDDEIKGMKVELQESLQRFIAESLRENPNLKALVSCGDIPVLGEVFMSGMARTIATFLMVFETNNEEALFVMFNRDIKERLAWLRAQEQIH